MDGAEEMEIEQQPLPLPIPNTSSKRFGIKNSIQTNFGDDYVFQIVPKNDWTSMAVSLSTNAIKLYSAATGHYIGECNGHSSTINQIAFSGPSSPHVLYSCSSDGTLRAWDTRSFQQVFSVSGGPSQEIFSFSFGGANHNLLAAGCNPQLLFWDWRTKRQVACLEDSHTEDVTQVHFIPGYDDKLISASVDGLICLFDTGGDINDDDHLVSVLNVGTSVGKVGFLGEKNQKLWCLTHIETLSFWDWKDERIEASFEDARALASKSWITDHVDYFVDCHYSVEEDHFWVIGGANGGSLAYFPVNYKEMRAIGPPEAVLSGGHEGIIRSVLSGVPGETMDNHGIFGWTGGEDGRLCCWLSDGSDNSQSWISTLALKSEKTRRKSRHSPY
ncbi:WD repeat-containing protein GTS1 [Nicotiana tabacum]|uniref:WD repeat-containing protein 89 homolog n=2 Tax=Nicotiana TaxID=4085 RepID=A0A1S3ZGM0_TOBAC|nr:PREDICTED: WD repeat-containing protein 89 homolog [Nicotiana sylvestris]XP_016463598.1 PREDICTED: WD repeat-containing protein 89 homolog [Nicotiana tabacum]